MKRKKPPIALISVLVVSMLGLVIAGNSFSFYNKSGEEQFNLRQKEAMELAAAQARDKPVTKAPTSKDSVDELKKQMQVGTPQVSGLANKVATDENERAFKTAVPSVVMPDESVQKPKENPTSPKPQFWQK